jgi:archaetidylinositol phosphate synthase
MLTTIKPIAEKSLAPIAHLLRHVNPNIISLTGLVFPSLSLWFTIEGWYAAALVMIPLTALDMMDGMVARAQGKVTAFGGLLDSTIDRFADFTVLAGFGFANIVPWEVVLPVILLSYLISYIRSRTELAAKGALTASVGIIERTERLIAVFVALLLYAAFPEATLLGQNLATWTMILLGIFSLITVAQRVAFAYRKLQ